MQVRTLALSVSTPPVSRPLLTLSSKYFATFPHGTCLLSVSWTYLVLGEVYHLLWAAFPSNPTPRPVHPRFATALEQVFHLLRNPIQEKLQSGTSRESAPTYTLQFAKRRARRFSVGLIPVHSPLLRESLLVSFPPLTDMLKFSR